MVSLVIDGSILLSKYMYIPTLLNSENNDVSVAYYFIKKVMNYIYEYEPKSVHLILDIGRDLKKKEISNKYKSNRSINSKPFSHMYDDKIYNRLSYSRKLIINYFSYTPVKIYALPFIEGDTICAYASDRESKDGNKTYLITNDKDFFQLLDKGINIIMIAMGKKRLEDKLYTQDNKDSINDMWLSLGFKDKHLEDLNKKPFISTIPIFRTILGDSSDGIKGIKGLKIKFIYDCIVKFMLQFDKFKFDNIDDFFDYIKSNLNKTNLNSKSLNKLKDFVNNQDYREIMDINFKLMDFDYAIDNISPDKLLYISKIYESNKRFDDKGFNDFIYKYEFDSIDDYKLWSDILLSLEHNDYSLANSKKWNKLYKVLKNNM